MKTWFIFTIMVFCIACKEGGMQPDPKPQPPDYLVFGHLGSFCINCDILYKIQNGTLYTTGRVAQVDPAHPSFTSLPSAKYELVKNLPSQFPSQLLDEKSESIGAYFPDVGATYIEVRQKDIVRHWYIQAQSTPTYLVEFVKQVNDAMAALN